MRRINGFSVVEGVILFGVVLLLAGVGYVGWKAVEKSGYTADQTTVSNGKSAEVITTKADLEAAEKELSELDFEDDEAVKAESQASL